MSMTQPAPPVQGGKHTKIWSLAIWGVGLLIFLAFELTGLERRNSSFLRKYCPWFTLSETEWSLLGWMPAWLKPIWRVLIIAFFASLGVHFSFGTPLLP